MVDFGRRDLHIVVKPIKSRLYLREYSTINNVGSKFINPNQGTKTAQCCKEKRLKD